MLAVPNGPPDPDAQRWSPFPVQDWSTMPAEGPGSPAGEPPPSWPAPRGEGLPFLIMLVVAALLAGMIYVVHDVGVATADRGAARYVPADGAVWYTRQEVDPRRYDRLRNEGDRIRPAGRTRQRARPGLDASASRSSPRWGRPGWRRPSSGGRRRVPSATSTRPRRRQPSTG